MGKTIIVYNLELCEACKSYGKVGCYLSLNCTNKESQKDNSEPNKLLYEECAIILPERYGPRIPSVKPNQIKNQSEL